jgi:ABC-type phosphate/phosphonate transport system substrate-binding protein
MLIPMTNKLKTFALLALVYVLFDKSFGQPPVRIPDTSHPIRIGAVAYSPDVVTVFQGLTSYLNKNGLQSDYVLYSNYDSLVRALDHREVDIAWNTPLAHAKFHVQNRCNSQTLVMRDVDFNVRSVLVVRTDSPIKSPTDLTGRQLVLGSSQAAEATVLPLYYLKNEGVDLSKVEILSLDEEVDSKGNPCSSPWHVLQALRDGRGDAGIITEDLWNGEKDRSSTDGSLRLVWTSPPFSHCVFTAAADFDKSLASRFTELMTAMNPNEPTTSAVMRLEGTNKWLRGSPEGFENLVEAVRAE